LDDLAGPDRAAQTDILAEGAEDRFRALERRRLAADHDGQRAGLSAGGAPGDRRVEKLRTLLGEQGGAAPVQLRTHRGVVSVDLTGAGRAGELAEYLLHALRRRQRSEHDLRALG